MSKAVRYFSRSGNTKKVAEKIAEGAGTTAVSVDEANGLIDGYTDVLFIGGALYAYGIDNKLGDFLDTLEKEKVGKAVLFSTSWLSKHALKIMEKALEGKGIPVEEETFYCKSKAVDDSLESAKEFGSKF